MAAYIFARERGRDVPKHIGIVAVSAEGAALCYRTICAEGAASLGPHAHPEVTMHTFPLSDYMRHIDAGRWDEVGAMLLDSGEKLRKAGADFLICPDNTVHEGLDLVRDRSPLPWLHIAEEVARVAAAPTVPPPADPWNEVSDGRTRLPGEAAGGGHRVGAAVRRRPPRRSNATIFDELVRGRLEASSRSFFVTVIAEGKRRGADAAVLGCTEIPLLVGEADSPLPTLDSTRLLARAALREATTKEMRS